MRKYWLQINQSGCESFSEPRKLNLNPVNAKILRTENIDLAKSIYEIIAEDLKSDSLQILFLKRSFQFSETRSFARIFYRHKKICDESQ